MSFAAIAPLARVPLARSPGRLLALPVVLVLLGAGAVGLAALVVDGAPEIALAIAGAAVAAIGLWLAVRVVSIRLMVEPGALHLRGLGVDRRYQLARGSLARVPTAGPRKLNLGLRLGSLGWAVGRATLPSGERVHVIRLGATPSVILVPTEEGRLALAVASEETFVDVLVEAARPRPRAQPLTPAPVAEAAAPVPIASVSAPAEKASAPPVTALPTAAPVAAPMAGPPLDQEPMRARPLTGIERMWLEERLARERRAAYAGAREEQAAASFTASVAALTPAGGRVAPSLPAPAPVPMPTVTAPVPAAPVPAPPVAAAASVVVTAPAMETAMRAAVPAAAAAATLPRAIPRRRPARPMARRITRPELTPVLVLVTTPLVGALFSWVLAVILGLAPGASGMDPLAAALLLCGPVAAVAIFLAYSRWPRLAGLSSVAAMLALLLVTRAVIG
ncbi:MAG: hypothetical protein ACRDFZ_01570 [Candidatus Limnocylindria bacterium]